MTGSPPLATAIARLARRLAALVYETLIAAAILLVAGFALTPLMSPVADPGGALTLPGPARRIAGFALLAAILGAYFIVCWSGGRRTLPMKTWRMRLVDARGAPVTPPRALARYVAGWIGPAAAIALYAMTHSRLAALALALPYAWALVDPDRRFLHDRLAGTRLVGEAA
ncbi:MAG: RDD family protein [Betaproteobacteria bacterium]